MKTNINVQDQFLQDLKEDQKFVTVTFNDGSQLKGTVKSFDTFTIFLEADKEYLIYKHAVCRLTVG